MIYTTLHYYMQALRAPRLRDLLNAPTQPDPSSPQTRNDIIAQIVKAAFANFVTDFRLGTLRFLVIALVMIAELTLAVLLRGLSPAHHLDAYRHFTGAMGRVAQLGHAPFPALRRDRLPFT